MIKFAYYSNIYIILGYLLFYIIYKYNLYIEDKVKDNFLKWGVFIIKDYIKNLLKVRALLID